MRRIERVVLDEWSAASQNNYRKFPHEFLYKILRECRLKQFYEIDPADSWMVAAANNDVPLFVPGWEDSTLGNIFAARCITGAIGNVQAVRSGIEYMIELAAWYRRLSKDSAIGFFQIGGGIAGDFPICVVPMLNQDVVSMPVPEWAYFCQISDSTTSFGSYSGAVPNEKITWGKLNVDTPRFVIESDATIVTPLVFAKILGW
jgi:deoxyhypusine synthase